MIPFKNLPVIQKAMTFYGRYNKYVPVLFFFGGFTWDSLTLTRIDRISDNLILLGYLTLLGAMIVLVNSMEIDAIKNSLLVKYKEWYPLGIQFFLGGLFSSYVVFYFQSASFTKTLLFLGLLVLLLIANEFLERRLTNLYLQASLFFLSSFSFFTFFLPVITKRMTTFIFILGGFLSLGITIGMVSLIHKKLASMNRAKFLKVTVLVVSVYLLLNFFYVENLIPPVPISLKSGAIYHNVSRSGELYKLKFQKPKWYQFWKNSDDPFFYSEGDTVYCFTAIFAPTALQKNVYHVWQQYYANRKGWLITDRLGFEITGGRKGGWRGYTYKRNILPGKWRVDLVTEEGLIIGRLNFDIKESDQTFNSFEVIYR